MKNVQKIGVIGHFGGKEKFTDGQTVKTKILCDELEKRAIWEIVRVDTYYKKKNPVKLIIDTVVCFFRTKNIIVLLSGNGMRVYFPILYICATLFNKNIYHDVIGGNLDSYVKKYGKFRKYLNSFKVNWVETEKLKKRMEKCGVVNCAVMPNFKRLKIADKKYQNYGEPYRFCTFSRVMKEKGIESAIETIEQINRETGKKMCSLDIYGMIDDSYKDDFQKIMEHSSDSIRYMGVVPYDKSCEAISGYYALLFPTYWNGEGFPGTIIDAFSAGIPTIASDWNCNGEIIDNLVNGILYPSDNINTLKEAVIFLIENTEKIPIYKENCLREAKKYMPDVYIDKIIDFVKECSS